MSDTALVLILFGVVAVVVVIFIVAPEWKARREARKIPPDSPWELRSRRDQELDAITRGKDPRR